MFVDNIVTTCFIKIMQEVATENSRDKLLVVLFLNYKRKKTIPYL